MSAAMYEGMDGGFSEAASGEIKLDDHEAHVVKNMLDFLYTGTYDDGRGKQNLTLKSWTFINSCA